MLFSCSRRPEVEKWWALFSWLSAQNMLDNYEGFLHYVLPTTRGQITLKKQVQDLIATVEQFGEGNGNTLQYSCLENAMVATSRTGLSSFNFTFHFHALEKKMAAHSSVLAWRIPGMAEPGRPSSMGSHRVGHD